MKPIKCPNCGKRMVAGYFPGLVAAYECDGCGVRGPIDDGGSVRLAARLTREWIARMEAKTCTQAEKCASRNIPVSELINRWVDSELNAEV